MPIINSSYQPLWYLRNPDVQTILPAIMRVVRGVHFKRERINTSDGDFLDIDWLHQHSNKVALLVHGLEASTNSSYIRGMAKTLHYNGWNVAAMNLRGVTHQHHELKRTYHSGATEDVAVVVNYLEQKNKFDEIALIGFSLGGNLVVKYAGESGDRLTPKIKKAVAISVPGN